MRRLFNWGMPDVISWKVMPVGALFLMPLCWSTFLKRIFQIQIETLEKPPLPRLVRHLVSPYPIPYATISLFPIPIRLTVGHPLTVRAKAKATGPREGALSATSEVDTKTEKRGSCPARSSKTESQNFNDFPNAHSRKNIRISLCWNALLFVFFGSSCSIVTSSPCIHN